MSLKLKNRLTSAVFAVILAFCMSSVLLSQLFLPWNSLEVLKWCFLSITIFTLVFYNIKSCGVIMSGAFIYLAFLFVDFKNLIIRPEIIEWFTEYGTWIYDAVMSRTPIHSYFPSLTMILICLLISLLFYVFSVPKMRYLPITIITVPVFYVLHSYGRIDITWQFYLYMFALGVYFLRSRYYKMKKQNTGHYPSEWAYTLATMPMAMIFALVAIFAPKNPTPIAMPMVDNLFYTVNNSVYTRVSGKTVDLPFSIASVGFGSFNGRLGSSASSKPYEVMTVKSDKRLYLKGRVFDNYTGKQWLVSDFLEESRSETATRDGNELIYGLVAWNKDVSQYLHEYGIDVNYTSLRTKSLMMPYLPTAVSVPAGEFVEKASSAFEIPTEYQNLNYTASYMQVDYKNPDIINLMKISSRSFYRELAKTEGISARKDWVKKLAEVANEKDYYYTTYTQLPSELPYRIYALANEITDMAYNDYDRVKAIEEYLADSGKFEYNLSTVRPPFKSDFVDHFLFESNEGYCSHFATSMVVLCRALGIPARYVEGFRLPPQVEKEDGLYHVTNLNAHAWAEVYFPGVGFVPFEPTAAFNDEYYSQDNPAYVGDNDYSEEEEYYNQLQQQEQEKNENSSQTEDGTDLNNDEIDIAVVVSPLIFAGVLGILSLWIYVIACLSSWKNWEKSIKTSRDENTVLSGKVFATLLYNYLLKSFKRRGFEPKPGETPREFAGRIDSFMPRNVSYLVSENAMTFAQFNELYERAVFGNRGIDHGTKDRMLKYFTDYMAYEDENDGGYMRKLTRAFTIKGKG